MDSFSITPKLADNITQPQKSQNQNNLQIQSKKITIHPTKSLYSIISINPEIACARVIN